LDQLMAIVEVSQGFYISVNRDIIFLVFVYFNPFKISKCVASSVDHDDACECRIYLNMIAKF